MKEFLEGLNLLVIGPFVTYFAVCCWLIWHHRFDDGFFGRIAMAVAASFSFIIILVEWSGVATYSAPPEMLFVLWAIAFYMLRHAYRFYCWTKFGDGDWRNPLGKGKRVYKEDRDVVSG